jgi:hypothetical protein
MKFKEILVVKKTWDEVQKLKNDWFYDPVWDLEHTEGFEDHKEELLTYSLRCKKIWERETIKNELVELIERKKKELLTLESSFSIIVENEK